MLFDTTIPTIITTPINDITFSVVCVTSKKSRTPASPGGTASKMIKGSVHDANCATSTRYTSTTDKIRPMPKLLNEDRIPSTDPRSVTRAPSGIVVSFRIFSICGVMVPRFSVFAEIYKSITRNNW